MTKHLSHLRNDAILCVYKSFNQNMMSCLVIIVYHFVTFQDGGVGGEVKTTGRSNKCWNVALK